MDERNLKYPNGEDDVLCSWIKKQIIERSIPSKSLHILCDFDQNFTLFYLNRKAGHQIHMELQGAQTSHSNAEKEKNWRTRCITKDMGPKQVTNC